ncbi:MAG: O-antigen ligase family protein, partial [Ignavibacteriaceae bacterium]|nr:O-antigen ligase family protein [Ignavibacteriaceae bacterium]
IALSILLLGSILYFAFSAPYLVAHIFMFSLLADTFVGAKANMESHAPIIGELTLVLLTGFAIVKFLYNFDKKQKFPSFIVSWIPFLLWALLVGLIIAIDRIKIISYWKDYYAGFLALCITFYSIKNKTQLKSLIYGIIIWGLILSFIEIKILVDLGGFATGFVALFIRKNLLSVGWGKSNYLASFYVIIIPLAIGYLFYTNSRRLKILITISLVIMVFATILTLSRGGILALAIALIILFSRVLKAKTLIPFAIILVIVSLVILLNPLTYVLFHGISTLDTSVSTFSRIGFYEEVWKAFLNNPITGVGVGNLNYYANFISVDSSPAAHNILLGALGEVGIVGTIFFIAIFGSLLRHAFSGFKNESNEAIRIFRWCIIASFIGGIMHSMVEPIFDGLQFSIMFWTIAGIYMRLDLLKVSDI